MSKKNANSQIAMQEEPKVVDVEFLETLMGGWSYADLLSVGQAVERTIERKRVADRKTADEAARTYCRQERLLEAPGIAPAKNSTRKARKRVSLAA